VAILWLHVLCGLGWVGVAASFTLSATALGSAGAELRDFIRRVIDPLNVFCVFCAAVIPITGLLNLAFLSRTRGFVIGREFGEILAAKIALFSVMAWLEWRVLTLTGSTRINKTQGELSCIEIASLVRSYGIIIIAGAAALGLGVWLAGVR
jgi:putative copper export protein